MKTNIVKKKKSGLIGVGFHAAAAGYEGEDDKRGGRLCFRIKIWMTLCNSHIHPSIHQSCFGCKTRGPKEKREKAFDDSTTHRHLPPLLFSHDSAHCEARGAVTGRAIKLGRSKRRRILSCSSSSTVVQQVSLLRLLDKERERERESTVPTRLPH